MPTVFLHQNSSARLLVIYRSVGISLRMLAGTRMSVQESLRKGRKKEGDSQALSVARGKLYTPAGYLLTVNTTAVRCATVHSLRTNGREITVIIAIFQSDRDLAAVAAIEKGG